jgi:hypothetical protein
MKQEYTDRISWINKLAIAFLWVLSLLLWVGIFTSIMIGIAEYQYPVGTLSKYQYEK